jgi:hypothetical protein
LARKGVKQWSPLFELEGFDVFKDTPVEPMHCFDIGITQAMLDHLTKGQSEEAAEVKEKLDKLLLETKSIREMSRRLRGMAYFPQFKASEFQTIGLCIFPFFFGVAMDYHNLFTDDEIWR